MKNSNTELLFLDDVRFPKDAYLYDEKITLLEKSQTSNGNWLIVRNYNDFRNFIKNNGIPRTISFDNDLHPNHYEEFSKASLSGVFDWTFVQPKMGLHCLQFVLEYCKENQIELPTIYLHSANPYARQEMNKMLGKSEKVVDNFSKGGIVLS